MPTPGSTSPRFRVIVESRSYRDLESGPSCHRIQAFARIEVEVGPYGPWVEANVLRLSEVVDVLHRTRRVTRPQKHLVPFAALLLSGTTDPKAGDAIRAAASGTVDESVPFDEPLDPSGREHIKMRYLALTNAEDWLASEAGKKRIETIYTR